MALIELCCIGRISRKTAGVDRSYTGGVKKEGNKEKKTGKNVGDK